MLLRNTFRRQFRIGVRVFSSAAAETQPRHEDFRTKESDPTNHNTSHLNRFYTISPQVKEQLFTYGGLPKLFVAQAKTFTETCLMVREPAVEIINYLKNTDFSKPVNRFVLYGKEGSGRSLTLAHLLHYALVNDFVLVHVPWAMNWYRRPKETATTPGKEGFVDVNIDAASWLVHFKTQNTSILTKLDLRCSREYNWSTRESTPAGATLLELVDHGINRVKFATDAVAVLIEELKTQSIERKCRTMVAIDGYNAFFHPTTRIKNEAKKIVSPDKITLTAPFLNITNHDWSNGVCILTVDGRATGNPKEHGDSDLPYYQLYREGFEHIDPFIPIATDNYNDAELQSCIDYYLNRKWIQQSYPGIEKELKFLSGSNPHILMKVCAPL